MDADTGGLQIRNPCLSLCIRGSSFFHPQAPAAFVAFVCLCGISSDPGGPFRALCGLFAAKSSSLCVGVSEVRFPLPAEPNSPAPSSTADGHGWTPMPGTFTKTSIHPTREVDAAPKSVFIRVHPWFELFRPTTSGSQNPLGLRSLRWLM
jgi:hypothetical protein